VSKKDLGSNIESCVRFCKQFMHRVSLQEDRCKLGQGEKEKSCALIWRAEIQMRHRRKRVENENDGDGCFAAIMAIGCTWRPRPSQRSRQGPKVQLTNRVLRGGFVRWLAAAGEGSVVAGEMKCAEEKEQNKNLSMSPDQTSHLHSMCFRSAHTRSFCPFADRGGQGPKWNGTIAQLHSEDSAFVICALSVCYLDPTRFPALGEIWFGVAVLSNGFVPGELSFGIAIGRSAGWLGGTRFIGIAPSIVYSLQGIADRSVDTGGPADWQFRNPVNILLLGSGKAISR